MTPMMTMMRTMKRTMIFNQKILNGTTACACIIQDEEDDFEYVSADDYDADDDYDEDDETDDDF